MCEYCGCQAITVIGELTREHETVLNLLADVEGALARGDMAETAAVARAIGAVLEPHTAVEEHGVFPALAGDFADHIAALEADHRRIEAVLSEATINQVAAPPADPTWPARLRAVARLLHEHILKEQDGVFPAALATLSSDDWELAEKVRSACKTSCSGLRSSVLPLRPQPR